MTLVHVGVVPPRSKSRYAVALFALLGAVPSACVYDASDRCGPHQVMYQNLRCVCDAESAPTATGCVLCGADEVPGASGCTCKPGYSKPEAGGLCEPTPMGLGTACEVSTDCKDAKFDHCEAGTDGKGYCTDTGCSSSAAPAARPSASYSTSITRKSLTLVRVGPVTTRSFRAAKKL